MKQTVAPSIPALSELDRPALAALLSDIDVASYRTDQIFDAAWRSTAASWSEVTTLGKPLQAALESRLRYEAFSEIVRVLISHPMESGQRRDTLGLAIPRDIITTFTCAYNGDEVFRAELFPAMSANPFITFTTIAVGSGTLVFNWTGDNGFNVTESATITVE